MTEFNTKEFINNPRMGAQSTDPVTGTTDNNLTEVFDLDVRRMGDTTLTISNAGANSLYYIAKCRNEYESGEDFVLFFNEVVTGNVDELILVRHARIFVYAKSHVTNNHTDYKIECISGR